MATLQTSGTISISDIKSVFSSINANDLNSYRGKPWYRPSDGATGNFPVAPASIGMSCFYGKTQLNATVTISTSQNNVKIKCLIPGYVAGQTTAIVTVNSGVFIGSSSSANPSMYLCFQGSDNIIIINNGNIFGAGGGGGSGGYGDASPPGGTGGTGGTAICATNARGGVSIINNGYISGGGGGGGGGSGYKLFNGGYCQSYTSHQGSSGSGGAGVVPGGGSNAGFTYTGGGRTGGCEYGGAGGNLGLAGSPGGGTYPGAGGCAGYYIKGIANLKGGALQGSGTKGGRVA
jgi:hypothetical protein